jgi:DNA-binding MarR family transcriptional regulator
MHITSGTMTSVLDTLERNGYIVRLTDPDDRRRVLVDVTPAAQEVLDLLLPEVVQTTTAVMAGIEETELHDLLATLARIREAIAAAPDDLGPPAPRRTPSYLKRS